MGIPSFEEMKALQAGAEEERKRQRKLDLIEFSLLSGFLVARALKLGIPEEGLINTIHEQWGHLGKTGEDDGHQQDQVSTVSPDPPSK